MAAAPPAWIPLMLLGMPLLIAIATPRLVLGRDFDLFSER